MAENNENINKELEVEFPKELFEIQNNETSTGVDFNDFSSLLAQLNKQVSSADSCVNELVKQKEDIKLEQEKLNEQKSTLENDRFNFEKQMKEEYQKLNDLKIDFEQEKSKIFNDIQTSREALAKKERDFEKYKKEQLEYIENSKQSLTNNYKQFEKIVNKFNSKIEGYNTNE